jgi:hypothetical protein
MKMDSRFAGALAALEAGAAEMAPMVHREQAIIDLADAYAAAADAGERFMLLARIIDTEAHSGVGRGEKERILQDMLGRDTVAGRLFDSILWDYSRPGGQIFYRHSL